MWACFRHARRELIDDRLFVDLVLFVVVITTILSAAAPFLRLAPLRRMWSSLARTSVCLFKVNGAHQQCSHSGVCTVPKGSRATASVYLPCAGSSKECDCVTQTLVLGGHSGTAAAVVMEDFIC